MKLAKNWSGERVKLYSVFRHVQKGQTCGPQGIIIIWLLDQKLPEWSMNLKMQACTGIKEKMYITMTKQRGYRCKTCSLSCSCHWGVRKSKEPRLDCPWHKRDCRCCCSGDGTQCQEDRPTAICRIHQRMYQRQDQATRWHHSSQQATTVLYSYPQGTQRKAAVDLPEEWCSTLLAIVHRLSDTWWKPLSSRKSSLSPITVKCRETSPRCQEWFAGVPGGSFWSTICSTKSVIDGAAVVQMLKPGTAKTLPIRCTYLNSFNMYHVSIWCGTATEGKGKTWKGGASIESAPVPAEFRTSTKNSSRGYQRTSCYRWGTRNDLHSLSPCSHMEADTRMLLHVAHAAQHDHQKRIIRTVELTLWCGISDITSRHWSVAFIWYRERYLGPACSSNVPRTN